MGIYRKKRAGRSAAAACQPFILILMHLISHVSYSHFTARRTASAVYAMALCAYVWSSENTAE